MISPRSTGVAAIGIAAILLTSCSGQQQQAVGIDSLTVATLGAIDVPQQAFIDRFDELSEGTIRVTVTENWTPADGGDPETGLAEAVAAGEVDIAWVPVRALSAIGVTGADALETPMLIQTHDQQRQVATGLAGEIILRLLRPTNIEGLALIPGPQQYAVASGAPLLGAGDWTGKTVAYTPGAHDDSLAALTINTLGATATAGTSDSVAEIVNGEVEAATAGIGDLVVGGATDAGPYLTASIPLWPKMSAIVVNRAVLDSLSTRQHGFVDGAVERARDLAMVEPDIATPLAEACAAGVRFGVATNDQVEAFEIALKPVYDRIANDKSEAKLYEAIEAAVKLKVGRGGFAVAAACAWVAPVA